MAQIGGTVTFKINGQAFTVPAEEGVKITIKDVKREGKMGSDGNMHYTEVLSADTISGTLFLTPGVSPAMITNSENVTVQVNMRNGKSGMLSNAVFTGDGEVDTKEGTMAFEFTGNGRWL